MIRLGTAVIVVVCLGVAAAAVVTALRGDEVADPVPSAEPTTSAPAPALPALGDVRRLPAPEPGAYAGVLLVGGPSCRPEEIDLATLTRSTGGATPQMCTAWASPSATVVAWVRGDRSPEGLPLRLTDRATGRTAVLGQLVAPTGAGTPAVADDGSLLVCGEDGIRLLVPGNDVRVVRAFTRSAGFLDQRCVAGFVRGRPAGLSDDRTAVVDLLTDETLAILPARIEGQATALVSAGDVVVVGELRNGAPAATSSAGAVAVPTGQGARIRKALLAPGGALLALRSEAGFEIVDLTNGRRLVRPGGTNFEDVAFSPDGRTIAAATRAGILFIDATTLAPQTLLPGETLGVLWLRS